MEAQGQTDRQTLLLALVSVSLPSTAASDFLPIAKAHLGMASGRTLMPLGAYGVFGAFLKALKELILLQVVVAGRGASAGAYSHS